MLFHRWTVSNIKSVPFGHKWTISVPGITINNPVATLIRTSINLETKQIYDPEIVKCNSWSTCSQTGHFYVTDSSPLVWMAEPVEYELKWCQKCNDFLREIVAFIPIQFQCLDWSQIKRKHVNSIIKNQNILFIFKKYGLIWKSNDILNF